jgi:hypothetical protein
MKILFINYLNKPNDNVFILLIRRSCYEVIK